MSKKCRKLLNIYYILIIVFVFIMIYLDTNNIVKVDPNFYVEFFGINVLFMGIMGLKTNSILFNLRFGYFEYSPDSIAGKIFNYIICAFGLLVIIFGLFVRL